LKENTEGSLVHSEYSRKLRILTFMGRQSSLISLFCLALLFVTLFTAISTAYTIPAGIDTSTYTGCNIPINRLSTFAALILFVLSLIIPVILLRKVHDAFWMKKELKALLFVAVFMAIPATLSAIFTPWSAVMT